MENEKVFFFFLEENKLFLNHAVLEKFNDYCTRLYIGTYVPYTHICTYVFRTINVK